MEFADGGDLTTKIERHSKSNTQLPDDVIWAYFIQTLDALSHLHKMKILHRDLKSANLFLTKEGCIKVGDLNVSKLAKAGLVKTQIGTPYYMSPEIWSNKPYDARSDVWSAGCILYELCALRPPFRGRDLSELSKRILAGMYQPVSSVYSKDLQSVIAQCLQVTPSKRPTADELLSSPVLLKHRDRLKGVMADMLRAAASQYGNPDDDMDGPQDLLGTIAVPMAGQMRNLKDRLPAPQYNNSGGNTDRSGNSSGSRPPSVAARQPAAAAPAPSALGAGAGAAKVLSAALQPSSVQQPQFQYQQQQGGIGVMVVGASSSNGRSKGSSGNSGQAGSPSVPWALMPDPAAAVKQGAAPGSQPPRRQAAEPVPGHYDAAREQAAVLAAGRAQRGIVTGKEARGIIYRADEPVQPPSARDAAAVGGIAMRGKGVAAAAVNISGYQQQQPGISAAPLALGGPAAVRMEARRRVELDAAARAQAMDAAAKGWSPLPSADQLYGGQQQQVPPSRAGFPVSQAPQPLQRQPSYNSNASSSSQHQQQRQPTPDGVRQAMRVIDRLSPRDAGAGSAGNGGHAIGSFYARQQQQQQSYYSGGSNNDGQSSVAASSDRRPAPVRGALPPRSLPAAARQQQQQLPAGGLAPVFPKSSAAPLSSNYVVNPSSRAVQPVGGGINKLLLAGGVGNGNLLGGIAGVGRRPLNSNAAGNNVNIAVPSSMASGGNGYGYGGIVAGPAVVKGAVGMAGGRGAAVANGPAWWG